MRTSPRPHWKLVMVLAAGALAVCGCASDGGDAQSTTGTPPIASASDATGEMSPNVVSPAGAGSQSPTESARSDEKKPASQLRVAADEVLALLAAEDYEGLAKRVHPDQGVRFTPFLTVDLEGDVNFTAAQVAELAGNEKLYVWGAEPGSGQIIKTTFAEYAKRFITNLDYAKAPVIAENERTSSGSSLDNVAEAYPNSQFVEYNFPGFDPQYGGMDWQSQRLVFAEHEGQLYLVGIVHDSWTP